MKQNLFYFDASIKAIADTADFFGDALLEKKLVEKKLELYSVQVISSDELQQKFRSFYQAGHTLGIKPEGFQPKAIFFDMDSTVIGQETIVELAHACGKRTEVEDITERAMVGELDFKQALAERVKVLAGLPESVMTLTQQRLIPEPGIKDFVSKASEQGVPCYLVSGGFIELAQPLATELGFAGCHANSLEVVSGRLSGKLLGTVVDADEKANFLLEICSNLNINPSDTVAVGDGANDIEMMKAAGLAVGYQPKAVLYPLVDALNHSGGHRFLEIFLFND